MPHLLYLGPAGTENDVRALLPDFAVDRADELPDVERLIGSCDAVLDASMRVRFGGELLERAHRLRLFVTATTGADHVDAETLAHREVPLWTLRGQTRVLRRLTPAAEHTWLLVLACARQLRGAVAGALDGEWDRTKYPGMMLQGSTLGIIGYGRIGRHVARYAQAFGMHCIAFDPYERRLPARVLRAEDLGEVLSESDVLTIHVPLNNETRGLVGSRELSLLKQGSILINTSRGEIVDEEAVVEALQDGRLAAVGVDVLSGEPDIEGHPLLQCARENANVIITPHIGGFSPEAFREVLQFSCKRIDEFFAARKHG